MTPDRHIVKAIKRYDKNLFIRWNESRGFFELWMKRPMSSEAVLITPVTKAIYDSRQKPEYCELDQRLIWWVWAADSHRWGGSKQHAMAGDSRFLEFMKNIEQKQFGVYRDMAKDVWQQCNAFYATKEKKKNGKPKFNNYKLEKPKFVSPDIKLKATRSAYARSSRNAKMYNYKRAR